MYSTLFVRLDKIVYGRLARIREYRRREGLTFLMGVNEITFTRVLCSGNLKVRSAVVENLCTASRSTRFVVWFVVVVSNRKIS